MKIEYNSGVTPFVGKHAGGNFQRGNYYNNLTSLKRNGRYRYPFQFDSSGLFIKCTRAWRQLSSAQQTAWNNWAATFPQPSPKVPGLFMSGYENFVSRNFYQLLFFGRNAPLITSPVIAEVDPTDMNLTAQISSGNLLLDYNWSRTGGDIWAGIFVSFTNSAGLIYPGARPRFMGAIENAGANQIRNGLLYNGYTIYSDASLIPSSPDWFLFPYALVLLPYSVYTSGTAGGYMKEHSLDYWNAPNSLLSPDSLLDYRGNGYRISNGTFVSLGNVGVMWSGHTSGTNSIMRWYFRNDTTAINAGYDPRNYGESIRLAKLATGQPNGIVGSYTDNSGNVYPTITWNGYEIMTRNLIDTNLNDGTSIPRIESNANWSAASAHGWCYYANDILNAYATGVGQLDVSNSFEKYFGLLPASGQWILVTVVKVGKENGQFLDAQSFQLQVQ